VTVSDTAARLAKLGSSAEDIRAAGNVQTLDTEVAEAPAVRTVLAAPEPA
jgi:hypothetical protein